MNSIQTLLQKEMDRREFLLYVGLIVITLIGVKGFFSSVKELLPRSKAAKGFGSGPYGG